MAILLFAQEDLYAAKEAESSNGNTKEEATKTEVADDTIEDNITPQVVNEFLELMGEKNNQVKLITYYEKYGKAILDQCDDKKQTALHKSAIGGCDRNFKYLLDMGANWKLEDEFGKTPLTYAEELKGKEQKVINRVYTFFFMKRKWLQLAQQPNKVEEIKSLYDRYGRSIIDATMYDGQTALMKAALNGRVQNFKFLLKKNPDLSKLDKKRKSVRYYVIKCKDEKAGIRMSNLIKEISMFNDLLPRVDQEALESKISIFRSINRDFPENLSLFGKEMSSFVIESLEERKRQGNRIKKQIQVQKPVSDINTAKKSSSVKKPAISQLVMGNKEKILKVEKEVQAQEHRHSLVQREIGSKVEVNTESIKSIKKKEERISKRDLRIGIGLIAVGSFLIGISVAAGYSVKKK